MSMSATDDQGPGPAQAAAQPEGPLKPYDAQRPFLTRSSRFHAFVSGIGAGKTVAGIIRVLLNVDRWNPGETGMIIAPTVPALRNVILPELERWGILARCKYNKSEKTLVFPNGSKVVLESADNDRKIQRLRGPSIAWFWIDEAAVVSPQAWDIMVGRLRAGQYRNAFITTTPKGKNWVFDRFYDADDVTGVFNVPTSANPYLPQDYVGSVKSEYDGAFYEQEVLGVFTEFEGLVYPWFTEPEHAVDPATIPPAANFDRFIYGIDWGFNNPSVVLALGVKAIPDGAGGTQPDYTLVQSFYESRCTTEDVADVVNRFYDAYRVGPVYCDPSGAADIEQLNREGIDAQKAVNDVLPGIKTVTKVGADGRLTVAKHAQAVIDEFSQYQWVDEETSDKPLKVNDHAMDALRYAIMSDERGGSGDMWHFGYNDPDGPDGDMASSGSPGPYAL